VNEELAAGRFLARAWEDSHDKSAAALPREPISTNEILIRFTDRVVVDFYAPGESTHARQLLPCAELPCCYQKHDLFCELLLQRNLAVLADLPRPRANVASDHPGNRRTSRLATTYKVPVK
jgi:hypothetical protein